MKCKKRLPINRVKNSPTQPIKIQWSQETTNTGEGKTDKQSKVSLIFIWWQACNGLILTVEWTKDSLTFSLLLLPLAEPLLAVSSDSLISLKQLATGGSTDLSLCQTNGYISMAIAWQNLAMCAACVSLGRFGSNIIGISTGIRHSQSIPNLFHVFHVICHRTVVCLKGHHKVSHDENAC